MQPVALKIIDNHLPFVNSEKCHIPNRSEIILGSEINQTAVH